MKLVFSLPHKLLSKKNWLFLGLGYSLIKFQSVGPQASHCHYCACVSCLVGSRAAFDKFPFCAQIRICFWALRCADLFSFICFASTCPLSSTLSVLSLPSFPCPHLKKITQITHACGRTEQWKSLQKKMSILLSYFSALF